VWRGPPPRGGGGGGGRPPGGPPPPTPRVLAAVFLLASWLPFNLGVRPEPYVALSLTSVLVLLWRARGPAALSQAALVAGLTIPFSSTGILVAAPVVVFSPRIVTIVRNSTRGWPQVLAQVLLLCGIGATALTVIFANQTWDGLVTATHWHNFFGPALPWYREPARYEFLLNGDQGGNAGKRMPVLLTLAMLPVVGALLIMGRSTADDVDRSARKLAGVALIALALLSLTPSKWSLHFGALAGLFASFLTVAVVVLLRRIRTPVTVWTTAGIGLAGAVLVAAASGLAFAGPNSWWQPAVYDLPWTPGPVRPISFPLDSPLWWLGALAVGYAVLAALRPVSGGTTYSSSRHSQVIAAPAAITLAAAGTAGGHSSGGVARLIPGGTAPATGRIPGCDEPARPERWFLLWAG
jgi:hypothetical protein